MIDKQFIDSGIQAYLLGQRFAQKIRVGKRFFGSMPIAMKVYGLTYKDLDNPNCDWRFEVDCFIAGYSNVIGNKQISISMETNLINGFSDQWGNKQ